MFDCSSFSFSVFNNRCFEVATKRSKLRSHRFGACANLTEILIDFKLKNQSFPVDNVEVDLFVPAGKVVCILGPVQNCMTDFKKNVRGIELPQIQKTIKTDPTKFSGLHNGDVCYCSTPLSVVHIEFDVKNVAAGLCSQRITSSAWPSNRKWETDTRRIESWVEHHNDYGVQGGS